MKLNGARILMECLLEQGVDTVFGFPGGTILNVYDALYDYSDKITHILTSHEQGAAHAADGYARSTGKTGVCFATSGPGATNLVTGIATAYMDSSSVVFITCNVAENLLGKDSFQEVDITGISMPITKNFYLVNDVNKLAETVREAFAIAESGRKGPIMIDILKNVTAEEAEYEPLPKEKHLSCGHLAKLASRHGKGFYLPDPDPEDLQRATALIESANRPMLLCGGGAVSSNASEEILRLAETLDAPVACTMMGLGSVPGDHRLFTGMLGMHGSRASNIAASQCDLLIAIGTRFNDRVSGNPESFSRNRRIIHIDIDYSELDKNIISELGLTGDAKHILSLLLPKITPKKHPEWLAFVATHIAPAREVLLRDDALSPTGVMRVIQKYVGKDSTVTTDVGQHQIWAAQAFQYTRPRQLLTSGGFGTMGFGLGAAIGAAKGNPQYKTVHIAGDGCFRMNCHELATVEHYGLPVISVVFNNGTLGMVRQWQNLLYEGRISQTTLDRGPDFVKLAEAYGIAGYRVKDIEEFEEAFKAAVESGRAAVIDCMMGIDEKVRPMVPNGKSLTEFLLD
ncbi:MAG: biosynthetic-type acetolactate synthase large subunit [Firmicutes bacterium]|nr:biosynthetic-type acetolactate synthase large subunit [Bacillota bacterium]